MTFSIGKQLGLGFGAVIGLMVVSTAIAYFNLRDMNRAVNDVFDEAVPTVRTCDKLLYNVNESVTALRGFVLLGASPEYAHTFKADRANAWKNIDASLLKLTDYVQTWNDRSVQDHLAEFNSVLYELRDLQQQIEAVAHTADNVPAHRLLFTEIIQHDDEAYQTLAELMDEEASLDASNDRKALFAALSDLRASIGQYSANLRAYVLTGDDKFKKSFAQQRQLGQNAFDRVSSEGRLLTPQQQTKWQKFISIHDQTEALATQAIALREIDEWNKAQFLLEEESTPRARQLTNMLTQIAAAADQRRDERRDTMDGAGRSLSMSFLVGTIASVIVGAMIASLLSRKIVRMLRVLTKRADEISQGNLSSNELLTKSNDELGQLAEGFDTMFGSLKSLTGQILSVTENVNSAASQISSSAKQQACSTKQQASTIQEITNTMREITQTGSQIVEKAKEVVAAAENAAQQSQSGIAAVQNTSQTMESIREQVEDVAENIVALSEKTQAVGDIISTVNDIAEQSNLLALNATIEAADAGENGNRFSVVANEMKNLADQAKNCTVQVRSILGEIQKGITSAVMLTEEAVKRVESGKHQATVSESAIRSMNETTSESVQAFQQIIGATNQQQVGIEQVAKGMQDIDQATQQTASGTAQLEQAVISLSAMSRQLKSAVSCYKLQA
ncbi:MAG: methyl-accepting chemotaxis protein [Planctomycetaceae bacterium]